MPASSQMHSTGAVVEAAEHTMPVIADLVNMASAGAPSDIPRAPSTNWFNGEVGMDRGRGELLFDVQLELGDGQVAPIQVHEWDDVAGVAADVACRYGLQENEERRVKRYLQRILKGVS